MMLAEFDVGLSGSDVLLIGGSGFVGTNLRERLTELGCRVTVTYSPSFDNQHGILHPEGSVGFEIADAASYPELFSGREFVIYLAGGLVPATSNRSVSSEVAEVAAFATVVETCASAGVGRFVFISSGGAVYDSRHGAPYSEDDSVRPITTYGLNKVAEEHALRIICDATGMLYTIVRLSNPYGPYQMPGTGQGVVATFVHEALLGRKLTLIGDGSTMRDLVYVSDAVNGIVRAMGLAGEGLTLNVGSGVGTSIRELAETVLEVTDSHSTISKLPARPTDMDSNFLDVTLARKTLGWEPKVGLEEGIRRTVEWQRGLLGKKA